MFEPMTSQEERQARAYLLHEITLLINHYSPLMNVRIKGFTIKKMTSRWGSCNVRTHHLNFNLELARLPKDYLEYVVVHELTHLLEASHNAVFWNYMEVYLPGARQKRKELNDYSRRSSR